MHIPSERIRDEMNSEPAPLWYVPANGGQELAVLMKAPTSCIKARIAGCALTFVFDKFEPIGGCLSASKKVVMFADKTFGKCGVSFGAAYLVV